MSEKVSGRAKAKGQAGSVVALKLKRSDHRLLTRRATLREPTQAADAIHRAARALLDGVADPGAARRLGAERAADAIRARWGSDAIIKGRDLR